MEPEPRSDMDGYTGSGKLAGKRALITGGDSGIGRAVGVAFAKEGADVAFAYLSDEEEGRDAGETTFHTNVFSFFWTTKAALRHMPDGGAIVNTSSINGLRGNKTLIDYSATKGAIPRSR